MPDSINKIQDQQQSDAEVPQQDAHHEEEEQPQEEEQNIPVAVAGENAGGDAGTGEDILGSLGDQGNDEGDNRENVRQAVNPKTRRSFLRQKLVTEYKEKKEETNADSLDTGEIRHTDSLRKNAKADSIAEYLGYGSIGGAAGSAIGAYGAAGIMYAGGGIGAGIGGAVGGIMGGKEGASDLMGGVWNETKNISDTILNDQTSKDVFESIGIAGNVAGTVSSGIKMGSNIYRARKDKNKYKRNAAKHRAAAGAFSGISEIAGGLSHGANLGLFGDRATKEGSTAQQIGGVADIASGTAGFISKILDYTGNKAEKSGHKQTAEDSANYAGEHSADADAALTASRNTIAGLKNKKASELTDDEKTRLKQAREKRHTAKAQKYAMAQAAKLHKTRSEESTKGLLGMIGGGLGFLGSGITGLSKILGNTGGLLGTAGKVLGALSGITKTIGGIQDFVKGKKEKKKLSANKHEVVEEYIRGKIEKIKRQANEMQLQEGEDSKLGTHGRSLSDDEAKRIAILRLGVDIPDSTAQIPDNAFDDAFKKLTEKRARNILKSSDAEKEQMLSTLGLDNGASFEDVVTALEAS